MISQWKRRLDSGRKKLEVFPPRIPPRLTTCPHRSFRMTLRFLIDHQEEEVPNAETLSKVLLGSGEVPTKKSHQIARVARD